jgi:hypothetical protein
VEWGERQYIKLILLEKHANLNSVRLLLKTTLYSLWQRADYILDDRCSVNLLKKILLLQLFRENLSSLISYEI